MIRPHMVLAGVILALLTTGCANLADIENIQNRASQPAGDISGLHTVGQTFVSHHARLQGIEVLLVVYEAVQSFESEQLVFHLRASPDSATDIATAVLKADDLKHNARYRFNFTPLPDSKDKSYYFFIELKAQRASKITVWSSAYDVYPEGKRYVDGQPVSGDLTFQTFYEYDLGSMLMDAWMGVIKYWWLAIPALVLFFVPGYLLLSWLFPKIELDLIEYAAVSVGLSLALIPVITFFCTLSGAKLSRPLVVVGMLVISLLAVWRAVSSIRQSSGVAINVKKPVAWCFALILVVSMAVRFLQLRGLAAPMGAASVHHAMISQLIIQQGRIPDSLQPYMPIKPFVYHFGFHSVVAFLCWLSNATLIRSLLIVGQIISGMLVLASYLLAKRLTGDHRVGLISALSVGLISPISAYHLSWGWYPELTGLAILPTAFVLTVESLRHKRTFGPPVWLASVALAGLVLTHYRVSVFFACLLLPYLLYRTYSCRRDRKAIVKHWLTAGTICVLTFVLTVPWLWNIAKPLVLRLWQDSSSFDAAHNAFPFAVITAGGDRYLLALSLIGFLVGLARRERAAVLTGLWVGGLLLVANPSLVGMAGTGMVRNTSVAIALFLPMSLLSSSCLVLQRYFLRGRPGAGWCACDGKDRRRGSAFG